MSASGIEWVFYFLTCGYLGVPIFFMISGYCIAAAAVNHREKGHPAARFFFRRFHRIYPPYWICFGVCLILSFLPQTKLDPTDLTNTQWVGNLLLFENYRHWFLPPQTTNPFLGVSWTLCYEEQFYILTGLILTFAPKALFPIFGLITAFVVLNTYNLNIGPLKHLGNMNQWQTNLDDLLFDSYWLFFAAGIGVFAYRTATSKLRYLIPIIFFGLILWEVRQLDWHTNRFATRVTTFGFALCLCAISAWDKRICSLPIFHPLSWLGTRSYSIYLIHLPLATFVGATAMSLGIKTPLQSILITLPISAVLSVVAGHIFYQSIERHWIPGSGSPVISFPPQS